MSKNPFRWANCRADVDAVKHELTIRVFLNNVICPAVASLEARIAELEHSNEPAACFIQADTKVVLAETKKAFALAVQSIWERQLRAYLCICAAELQPESGVVIKIPNASWKQLCEIFLQLRGIALNEFPSFEQLDTLQLVGNSCRHGDGPSALELSQRYRSWWPQYVPLPSDFGPHSPPALVVGTMDIPLAAVVNFVDAIVEFWRDAAYIYHESIERKHASLDARLATERRERTWLPQATSE